MRHVRALLAVGALILASCVSLALAQEVDVVDLSARLTVESSSLQKAQQELQTKRDKLKDEAAEVKRQKDDVEKLISARQEGSDSPDLPALADAEKALAGAQETFAQHRHEYDTAKEEYDHRLRDYKDRVAELNRALPKAVQEAGAPFPTEDELEAAPGDFQVENMELLSSELKGTTVGDGTPASLLQEVAGLPKPAEWAKGDKVAEATLRPGTPIATFNAEGAFGEGAGSHAAIFITQNKYGIWVYDQYKSAAGVQRPVDARFIRNRAGSGSQSNDASAYYVIAKRPADGASEPAASEATEKPKPTEQPEPVEESQPTEVPKPTEARDALEPRESPEPSEATQK